MTIFHVAGILTFQPPKLWSYSMRATASQSYEGLVAAAISHSHSAIYCALYVLELHTTWYQFLGTIAPLGSIL